MGIEEKHVDNEYFDICDDHCYSKAMISFYLCIMTYEIVNIRAYFIFMNIDSVYAMYLGVKRSFLEDRQGQAEIYSSCSSDSDNESYNSSEEEEQEGVLSGRRMVELGFLATKLDEGCSKCSSELKLSSCIGEIRYGIDHKILTTILYPLTLDGRQGEVGEIMLVCQGMLV
uniref:Uncharacterized protein LOC111134268 n=1 Tax=Crassostrea virginica TaxID=6565 RepID=A0A8B8EFJ9_CRAVI|nr:uncharacterized protein LOC111134268 [Crassostrea virginica]